LQTKSTDTFYYLFFGVSLKLDSVFGTLLWTWSSTFFIQRLQTFFYSCHVFFTFFNVF